MKLKIPDFIFKISDKSPRFLKRFINKAYDAITDVKIFFNKKWITMRYGYGGDDFSGDERKTLHYEEAPNGVTLERPRKRSPPALVQAQKFLEERIAEPFWLLLNVAWPKKVEKRARNID